MLMQMVLSGLPENGVNIKMDKITRITCDLDTTDISALIHCLKVFRKYKFVIDLTVRLSSSGNGYHIIAWAVKGRTLKKLIKIRRKAGDDKIRCDLDLKANRQIQVLFTRKKKKEIKNAKKTKTNTNRINSIDV